MNIKDCVAVPNQPGYYLHSPENKVYPFKDILAQCMNRSKPEDIKEFFPPSNWEKETRDYLINEYLNELKDSTDDNCPNPIHPPSPKG